MHVLFGRLFWVVFQSDERILSFVFLIFSNEHKIFFRNQAYIKFQILTLELQKSYASVRCGLSIFMRARWKLHISNIYLTFGGLRIYSSKVEDHENYNGEQISELRNKKNEKSNIYYNIFEIIVSRRNLFEAWLVVKNKASKLVHESNDETSKEFTEKWFNQVSEKLIKSVYNYKAMRQVAIPKMKGGFKFFIMISLRDKVVQKAFLQVLQPIWEGV